MHPDRQANARPLPTPCQTTLPFWEAAQKKQLLLQYDPATNRYQFWPRPASVVTGKANLQWRPASGDGHLYSYTVAMMPAAGFEDRGQYVVGMVELIEGVRIMAPLVGVTADTARIGMKLKLVWETLTPQINFPAFEPAE